MLDAAADAAALAAATQAQNTLRIGSTAATAQSAGQTAGTQMYYANTLRVAKLIGTLPAPSINVQVVGTTITASATYTKVTFPTVFGRLLGVTSLQLSNTATSTLSVPRYINISVAIDISQSMGLAATTTDIANLQSLTTNTPDGPCAFGCHVPSPGATVSNEQIAHNNNVELRIDVIKTATQNMINSAQSLGTNMISFGLYELQAGSPVPGQAFTTLKSPSFPPDYSGLNTAASNIDLGGNVATAGYGDSDFANSLPALTNAVPTSGNGVTQSTPVQYVFLMTDGVVDNYGWTCLWGHCTGPINPSWCDAMKDKGITVGVIYTTYLPMPTDGRYQALVASFANKIWPSLQACASPGWSYQASDAAGIRSAINALFKQATGAGVLTQ